jgi:hypothetical protein
MTASNMPSVWNNIVGAGDYGTPNNITTTVTNSASDADNYSYQVVENYENSTWVYYSRWVYGEYNTDGYWNSGTGKMNTWRYTLHQGIPFTEYNYKKPV